MNKKFLIGAFLFAGILSLAFLFLLPQSSFFALKSMYAPQMNSSEEEETAFESEFLMAFTGGGSVKCTFTQDDTSGTAYVSEGKIRVDSQGIDGQEFGNAIISDGIIYAWQSGSREGITFDAKKSAALGDITGVIDAEEVQKVIEESDPQCIPEEVDDSIFTPPSTVVFTDASEILEQGAPGNTNQP